MRKKNLFFGLILIAAAFLYVGYLVFIAKFKDGFSFQKLFEGYSIGQRILYSGVVLTIAFSIVSMIVPLRLIYVLDGISVLVMGVGFIFFVGPIYDEINAIVPFYQNIISIAYIAILFAIDVLAALALFGFLPNNFFGALLMILLIVAVAFYLYATFRDPARRSIDLIMKYYKHNADICAILLSSVGLLTLALGFKKKRKKHAEED
jgi:hypothetical protein